MGELRANLNFSSLGISRVNFRARRSDFLLLEWWNHILNVIYLKIN
jgi:hypothetical protein